MLSLLKKKNPYAGAAEKAYAAALERARAPVFYSVYGVPDTFDGRFDLLLIHLFVLIQRLSGAGAEGRDFNQALFDRTFADMDQTLREMGIGDMGVPKHMRRMMKAFNGRMHAYEEGLRQGEGVFAVALRRNLYGTLEDEQIPDIQKMVRYIKGNMEALAGVPVSALVQGDVVFASME